MSKGWNSTGAGVCWDADFRHSGARWTCHRFRGTRWEHVNSIEARLYLKNAYRVILTRARQGMIIFVPRGASSRSDAHSRFLRRDF